MRSPSRAQFPAVRRPRHRFVPFANSAAALLAVVACSAHPLGSGVAGSSDVPWYCTDTHVIDTACRCQISPLGGMVHIVDHCDPTMVADDAGVGDVSCCKEWLLFNGQRTEPFLCFCNPSNDPHARKCDLPSGDEIVDRCP